jgi:hypothetical protein
VVYLSEITVRLVKKGGSGQFVITPTVSKYLNSGLGNTNEPLLLVPSEEEYK